MESLWSCDNQPWVEKWDQALKMIDIAFVAMKDCPGGRVQIFSLS